MGKLSAGKLSALVVCLWSMSLVATGQTSPAPAEDENVSVANPNRVGPAATAEKRPDAIHWGSLIREWWLYIVMEQTERIVKESKTRSQLSGPFFRDWFNTVSVYRLRSIGTTTASSSRPISATRRRAPSWQAIFWQNNDHVRFSEQDFHSAAYRKRSSAGLCIRHRRCGAVENGTPERIQHRQRRPSGSLVGPGLQGAAHSLRRRGPA